MGASCVLWFCRGQRPDLGRRRDLALFVAGAAVLGPLAGGLVGASVNWVSTDGWWPGLALQWWAGDGIAVLVIGGPVLLWSQRRAVVSSRWAELVLVVLAAAALSVVAFRFGGSPFLLFLPILAWAAFRLGDLRVVLAGTAFACVANYMTAAGYGGLAHLGWLSPVSVAVTQAYIAIVVLTGWVLAQEVAGRMSAVHDRDSARGQREVADARRMAAELGTVLADAASICSVGEQVSAAVRARVAAAHVVISVLAPGGKRFEQLAGERSGACLSAMVTGWTIDTDAPGPQAVRDRAAVYLPDREAVGSGFADARQVSRALGLRSSAALPLLTEVGALGYLSVWWTGPHETTAAEREYLRAVADTASRALERTRLRQAERRERTRVETLAELTELLAAASTPQEIGEVAAGRVRAAVGGADALCLGLVSQDGTRLEWVTVVGYAEEIRRRFCDLPLTTAAAATDAVRTGRPVIIRTPGEYERRYPGEYSAAVAAQASSGLTWPLRAGTAPVGAIGLMWTKSQQFEPGQLAFLTAAADLIAQALVRARVYADEHAIAVLLQRAVMPTVAALIPGLNIGACYRQAGITRHVGGDWYDALALPGGRAYLAVGDVVGHGLAAAQDMTQLRNAGRALAITGHQPAGILGELVRITDWAASGKYATVAAAIIQPDVSLLTYATAGHPPILIRRARTGTVEIPPYPMAAPRSSGYANPRTDPDPGRTLPAGSMRLKLRLCVFGSLHAGRCGCPVGRCPPLVLVLIAAACSCLMAARSWASAALRKARMLAATARSAAASEAAIWRCAAASRLLGACPGASPWCSSSIRARTALIRCLISSPRLPPDSGSFSTWVACPPQMARPPSLIGESGFPCHSLNRWRQVQGAGPGPGCRTLG